MEILKEPNLKEYFEKIMKNYEGTFYKSPREMHEKNLWKKTLKKSPKESRRETLLDVKTEFLEKLLNPLTNVWRNLIRIFVNETARKFS